MMLPQKLDEHSSRDLSPGCEEKLIIYMNYVCPLNRKWNFLAFIPSGKEFPPSQEVMK